MLAHTQLIGFDDRTFNDLLAVDGVAQLATVSAAVIGELTSCASFEPATVVV